MRYITIWRGPGEDNLQTIKKLFEQNHVDYIFLDKTSEDAGAKVQVAEDHEERARGILITNGFVTEGDPQEVPKMSLWKWTFVAVLCLVAAAFLMYWLMD